MNLLDILLKLLPFTYFDKNKNFHWGISPDDADRLITGFIVLLIFISLFYGFRLWQSVGADKRRIHALNEILASHKDDFVEHFSEIEEKIKESKQENLIRAWREFDKTLVKTTNSFTGELEIHNTVGAEYFFNSQNLLGKVGSKYYAAIPSILLGIGLIGTFTGLFYGLMKVNFNDAKSMEELLQAAGAKFAASIWGLTLSLAFTFYEKRQEHQLELEIEKIRQLINDILPRQVAEQSLVSLENKAVEQQEILNSLSMNIAESLGEKITVSLIDNLVTPIQAMAANLGGTPENTLYDRLNVLSGGIGDDFSAKLETIFNSMIDEIRKTVGSDADGLKDTLSGLENSLSKLKDIFEAQQTQMNDNTTKQLDTLNQSISAMMAAVQLQNTELQNTLTELSRTLSDQNTHLKTAISGLITQVETQGGALQNAVDNLGNSATSTNERLASSSKQAFDLLQETVKQIENTITTSQEKLKNVPRFLQQFADSTAKLAETAEHTEKSTGQLQLASGATQTGIQSLNTAMQHFSNNLNTQQEKLSALPAQFAQNITQAKEIADASESTYKQLSVAYRTMLADNTRTMDEFKEQLTKFLAQVKAYSREQQDLVTDHLKATLTALDKPLQNFSQAMASAMAELGDAIESMSGQGVR